VCYLQDNSGINNKGPSRRCLSTQIGCSSVTSAWRSSKSANRHRFRNNSVPL